MAVTAVTCNLNKPKRMRAYKVPEKLQVEVERQINQMLANGIIRESNSLMVSPLVRVVKGKDGCNGVRLAVMLTNTQSVIRSQSLKLRTSSKKLGINDTLAVMIVSKDITNRL